MCPPHPSTRLRERGSASSRARGLIVPPCDCGRRNVYVCSRYPHHHCRACCPVDVMLLGDDVAPMSSPPLAFGSPIQWSPMSDQNAPAAAPPPQADAEAVPAPPASPGGSTPNSGLPPRPPRAPSAPTKSASAGGCVTSRAGGASAAVRSLTPIFNGFAPAASRFNELGGRFAVMRPQASAIARMQRAMSSSQDSGSPPAAQATPAAGAAVGRKRGREEEGGAGPAPSVRTVSRGREPRSVAWMLRSPDLGGPEGPGQRPGDA